MCEAFSCIVTRHGSVTWKLDVDRHEELTKLAGIADGKTQFARIEITPRNDNYLFPRGWEFRIDEHAKPSWFAPAHEAACWRAQRAWRKELLKYLNRKKIIHPFELPEPKRITKKHKQVLADWGSVGGSVGGSVWASVGGSVWASVGDSVWGSVGDSVWDSVGGSVGGSVRDSVWAYTGSFFKLGKWKYIKHEPGVYPFQPAIDLWEEGLVPSFDGKVWRLHSGPKARVRIEITKKELLRS